MQTARVEQHLHRKRGSDAPAPSSPESYEIHASSPSAHVLLPAPASRAGLMVSRFILVPRIRLRLRLRRDERGWRAPQRHRSRLRFQWRLHGARRGDFGQARHPRSGTGRRREPFRADPPPGRSRDLAPRARGLRGPATHPALKVSLVLTAGPRAKAFAFAQNHKRRMLSSENRYTLFGSMRCAGGRFVGHLPGRSDRRPRIAGAAPRPISRPSPETPPHGRG
jgi:hypothetical protein